MGLGVKSILIWKFFMGEQRFQGILEGQTLFLWRVV